MGGESQTKLKKTRKEWFSELSLQPGQAKSEADLYCKTADSRGLEAFTARQAEHQAHPADLQALASPLVWTTG